MAAASDIKYQVVRNQEQRYTHMSHNDSNKYCCCCIIRVRKNKQIARTLLQVNRHFRKYNDKFNFILITKRSLHFRSGGIARYILVHAYDVTLHTAVSRTYGVDTLHSRRGYARGSRYVRVSMPSPSRLRSLPPLGTSLSFSELCRWCFGVLMFCVCFVCVSCFLPKLCNA